jgi:tetratricopeptide (TPR) repeat protein
MQKKGLWFMLALGLVVIGFMTVVPAAIRALPDRYVMRLPEPLQKYGLPEDSIALLPTVSPPIAAADLLATSTLLPAPPPSTATVFITRSATSKNAPQSATPIPVTASPMPTAVPSPTATPRPRPSAARLEGIRHKFQTWNNCGPATLAMALTYFGDNVSQEQTAAILKPDPEDRNVSPAEMVAYVQDQTPFQAVSLANGTPETLRQLLANGIPVIVEVGIDPPGEFRWLGWYGHYLLLVAYDDAVEQFWVYDSWFGTSEEPLKNAEPDGRVLTYADLDTYWPQFNRNYIALFEPEQAGLVGELIGPDMDETTMWANALSQVRAEAASNPTDAFSWFNLGTIYNALGDYENAATAFDQARAIGLPWRMLWYQFGPYEAYYQTGRYEDVLLLTDVTLQDRPYFEESYYYKGLALAALGQREEARQNLEKALSFNPNFSAAAAALETLRS